MKTAIGTFPLLLGIPSYAYYVRSVYQRKTIPHVYSWLIWAVLATIGYIAQVSTHAGPGAWNTGFTAIVCFIVFLVSLKYGEHKLSRSWMIGDRESDVMTGVNAGTKTILVKTGVPTVKSPQATKSFPSLLEAIEFIASQKQILFQYKTRAHS